jgi:hypothetical protein
MTKRTQPQPIPTVTGCSFVNTVSAEANEHTRAAVEALANAAAENARAITEIAKALQPPTATFEPCIRIGGGHHD